MFIIDSIIQLASLVTAEQQCRYRLKSSNNVRIKHQNGEEMKSQWRFEYSRKCWAPGIYTKGYTVKKRNWEAVTLEEKPGEMYKITGRLH